jgi:hypothetical protein
MFESKWDIDKIEADYLILDTPWFRFWVRKPKYLNSQVIRFNNLNQSIEIFKDGEVRYQCPEEEAPLLDYPICK